jgi:hypothetical protein
MLNDNALSAVIGAALWRPLCLGLR